MFFSGCTTTDYLAPVINKNNINNNVAKGQRTITVYAGDSLYSISKREGVSIKSIIKPFVWFEPSWFHLTPSSE